MKSLSSALIALVGGGALFLLPASSAMAQKGGAKAGGAAKTGGAISGAKSSAPVSGVKSSPIAGNKSGGSVAINSGLGNNLASASRINRPNSGVGGNNIIIASGIGGGIYGGYGGYGGYPGYTGFNPYLSGYPFTSSVLPLDYAYTPYAGPTYIDPNLNNVRGYPPTNSLYSTPAPRLYPGGAVNPANPIPEVGPAPRAATATLEVTVPTLETELWFNGVKTQTQGLKREFVTPELVPGQSYAYELRARFVLNGKEYDQTRIITLHAGSQMVISISSDSREQLAIPAGIKI